MRRLLVAPFGLWLAGAACAEGPELGGKAAVAPSEKAAPVAPSGLAAGAAEGLQAPAEEEESAGLALLPPAAGGTSRGMDVLSRSRLDMMMPSGRSHRGVYYPMYRPVATDRTVLDPVLGGVAGVTAPLASLFKSEVMTRLDEDHVQFEGAQWVQFEEKPAVDGSAAPAMKLEMARGVYDLKNEILMTSQPVRIENRQFVVEGDTMLHDRSSGLTRLTGRVRMTFFQDEPEPSPPPSGAKPAAALPAAPPTPQPSAPRQP